MLVVVEYSNIAKHTLCNLGLLLSCGPYRLCLMNLHHFTVTLLVYIVIKVYRLTVVVSRAHPVFLMQNRDCNVFCGCSIDKQHRLIQPERGA